MGDYIKCPNCGEKTFRDTYDHGWYSCENYRGECGFDSDCYHDGIFYPTDRRGTLCSVYTGVDNFDTEFMRSGDKIYILTSRGTQKEADVIDVHPNVHRAIIKIKGEKNTRFLCRKEEIEDAFDALFPSNKRKYTGWWNRCISIAGGDHVIREKLNDV